MFCSDENMMIFMRKEVNKFIGSEAKYRASRGVSGNAAMARAIRH
jgi:hypothetical protein